MTVTSETELLCLDGFVTYLLLLLVVVTSLLVYVGFHAALIVGQLVDKLSHLRSSVELILKLQQKITLVSRSDNNVHAMYG